MGKDHSTIDVGVGKVRLQRDRPVTTRQRVLVAPQIRQDMAAIGVCLGMVRLERDRPVVPRQRLGMAKSSG